MKTYVVSVAAALVVITIFGQSCSTIKGHAFERTVLPGTPTQTTISEDGTSRQAKSRSMKSYLFYIEHKSDLNLVPSKMWIAGKPYSVKGEYLKGAPSLVTDDPNDKILWDSVATKTSKKILSIQPIDSLSVEATPEVKKKITDKNFVIEYTVNKKNKVLVIDSVKKLKKQAMY